MKTKNLFTSVSLIILAGLFLLVSANCKKKSDETSNPTPNETGTLTDIDGNVYKTVKIGSQWWMAENLKVTHYRNGDKIPNVTDEVQWENLTSGGICYYDNDMYIFGSVYGVLYNFYAVSNFWSVAPAGWHVPSKAEWTTLTDFLGGTDFAGGKMKEPGTAHWVAPNVGADNSSGLTILPGGLRYQDGNYAKLLYRGFLWTATAKDAYNAWLVVFSYEYDSVVLNTLPMPWGFSIRCVKDATK